MESEIRLDLDLLASETMELNDQIRELYGKEFSFFHDKQEEEFEELQNSSYPDTAGVIYYIKKSVNTFIIKSVSVESIADIFEKRSTLHYRKLTKLDLEDDSNLDHLMYFSTNSYEEADLIVSQFGSRRFPNSDELLYNISDPSESWWLVENENSLTIHFRTPQIDRSCENVLQIGPIGDVSIFSAMISKYESEFFGNLNIQLHERFCKVDSDSKLYDQWRSLLIDGNDQISANFSTSSKGLQFYLSEIACFRNFWIQVNDELDFNFHS